MVEAGEGLISKRVLGVRLRWKETVGVTMGLSRDNGRQEAGYPAFCGTPGLERPVVIMLRSAPKA